MIKMATGDDLSFIKTALELLYDEIEKIKDNKHHNPTCGCKECDVFRIEFLRQLDLIGKWDSI